MHAVKEPSVPTVQQITIQTSPTNESEMNTVHLTRHEKTCDPVIYDSGKTI